VKQGKQHSGRVLRSFVFVKYLKYWAFYNLTEKWYFWHKFNRLQLERRWRFI